MPRVPTYQGDRVRTGPLRMPRQGAVPTPATYGAQFGETLGHAADVVSQIVVEQRQRANEHFGATVDTQLNQLYQIQGLSSDRGPTGAKGLLTMSGMEPQEKLQENLRDYDAQTAEILKQAKNPEQRLLAERMVGQARARYVDSAMRHASAEYAKAETGQKVAQVNSHINLAGAAAGTPGGQLRIDESLLRIEEIIWFSGDTLGLHTDDEKRLAFAEAQSKVHVLAVNKLITSEKALEAQAYFDRVMTPSPGSPQGQIEESQAAALRTKLEINTTDAKAMQDQIMIWEKLGPKPGDEESAIRTADMHDMAQHLAGTDVKRFQRTKALLADRENAHTSQRRNLQSQRADTVWTFYQQEVPLATVRATAAFKALTGTEQSQLVDAYVARDRRRIEDARAARDEGRTVRREAREEYTLRQDELERTAWDLYNRLDDPAHLATVTRGELQQEMGGKLSQPQVQALLKRHEAINSSPVALSSATIDNDQYKAIAHKAGLTYIYEPESKWPKGAGAINGRLKHMVQNEIARLEAGGKKLTYEQKGTVMQQIIDEKVMQRGATGWVWNDPDTAVSGVLVNPENIDKVYVPYDRITDTARTEYENYLRGEPPVSEAVRRERMERAYGINLAGGTRAQVEAALKGARSVAGVK